VVPGWITRPAGGIAREAANQSRRCPGRFGTPNEVASCGSARAGGGYQAAPSVDGASAPEDGRGVERQGRLLALQQRVRASSRPSTNADRVVGRGSGAIAPERRWK
jgi:hypothetical protein